MNHSRISGLILAGGQANRMGTVNKGAQVIDSVTLAERVITSISSQVDDIFISANEYADWFDNFHFPVFKDDRSGFLGPLAGIETILAHNPSIEWLFCCPVDTPFLPSDLVNKLLTEAQQRGAKCAVPVHEGLRHPLHCLVHSSLLPSLTQFLDGGERSVGFWLRKCGMIEVNIEAPYPAFFNINTQDDLVRFQKLGK